MICTKKKGMSKFCSKTMCTHIIPNLSDGRATHTHTHMHYNLEFFYGCSNWPRYFLGITWLLINLMSFFHFFKMFYTFK